jgi:hypothetical protein
LDELAAVTEEYGRFFGRSAGFAAVLIGGWLLAAEALLGVSTRGGEFLFAVAPLVWIALVSLARAHYQRHGEVIGNLREGEGFGYRTMMLAAIFVAALVGIMRHFDFPRRPGDLFTVAAFVATPMLAIRFVRTGPQLAAAMVMTAFAGNLRADAGPAWYGWFRIAFGFGLALIGIFEHFRYRRLERRLAALKREAS